MKKIDHDALARCVEEYCRDPKHAKRFKERIAEGESWERCAMSACYSVQVHSMDLPTYGCPVCWADADAMPGSVFELEQIKAKVFADRLRAAGLSIFEPDPIKALQEVAESKQRELHVVESEQKISETDSPDAA